MADDDKSDPTRDLVGINRQILTKVAALEYVMISVCYTHPNREALGEQIADLFEYLKGKEVVHGEKVAELVENLTGFQRPEKGNAP